MLAAAHRGLLYVDEVNLLHDHLVDLLLDAAALGISYVEREGVSVRHAARFLLVGTMNPEEGELRPQLLDRFGLTVEVAASRDPDERAEVVRRRLAFEADPAGFAARFEPDSAAVAAGRGRGPGPAAPGRAAGRRAAPDLRGVRPVRRRRACARTWSRPGPRSRWPPGTAGTRSPRTTSGQAARLALPHRRRRDPFDAPGLDDQELEDALNEPPPDPPEPDPTSRRTSPGRPTHPGVASPRSQGTVPLSRPPVTSVPVPIQPLVLIIQQTPSPLASSARPDDTAPATPPFRARLLTVPGMGAGALGRRSAAYTPTGRTVGARPPVGKVTSVHLPATLPRRRARPAGPPPPGRPGWAQGHR